MTKEHEKNLCRKRQLLEQVKALHAQGLNRTGIAKELGLSRTGVWRYLKPEFNPGGAHYDQKHASKIKPYEETIKGMLARRIRFKEIETQLRKEGCQGASSTIRMYTMRERNRLIKLLYKPLGQVKGIKEEPLRQATEEFLMIGKLYDLMVGFKETLFAKKAEGLEPWMEEALAVGRDEITSFFNGISRDKEAVKNAIRYDYHNGPAEGSVNKLKVSKRIMYGRCGFDTLKKKLLLRERCGYFQQT